MAHARCNGVDLYFEDSGAGIPLLMVMGIGAQLVWWPPGFCDALAARGFRLIRFDNRDVGLSERLHAAGRPSIRRAVMRRVLGAPPAAPYTLADMAADAVGLLDHLGLEGAHVLGVSMGGMIAQEVAIRHPGRVHTLTSIMSNPGRLRHFVGSPRALRALLGPPPRDAEAARARSRTLFTTIGGPDVGTDLDWVGDMGVLAWERGAYPIGVRRQLAAIVATPARTQALRTLSVPSLVVHGRLDPLLPRRGGRATADAIPDARYLELSRMGHDLPRADWDTIADAMARLASDRPARVRRREV